MFFLDISCMGIVVPDNLCYLFSLLYKGLRIGIPILLIIVGMFDMGKAIVAKKEEDVKKAQSLLVKKIFLGVLVFLLPYLVEFIFRFLDGGSGTIDCVKAVLNYK